MICGKFFEKCIYDVSQKGEIYPYAMTVYILKAAADDLEPLRRPLQVCENQRGKFYCEINYFIYE